MKQSSHMKNKEQLIARLAAATYTLPRGSLELLKRAPNSLCWRLVIMCSRLKREVTGMMHRLQTRRVAHLLHIGKTGGTATKKALKGYECAAEYELTLHEHNFTSEDVPSGERSFSSCGTRSHGSLAVFSAGKGKTHPAIMLPGLLLRKSHSVDSTLPMSSRWPCRPMTRSVEILPCRRSGTSTTLRRPTGVVHERALLPFP
jgi:hypothetical protein